MPLDGQPNESRCAFVESFPLHADAWLHENDVAGLQRLCNYGARGPLSLERLSALPDGRLAYRTRRPRPLPAAARLLVTAVRASRLAPA